MAFDFNTFIASLGTVGLVVAVAGIILLIMAFAKVFKDKGTKKTFVWIGVVAVAISLVLPLIGYNLLGSIGAGTTTTTLSTINTQPTTTNTNKLCAVEDTTITLSAQDKYLSTSAGGTHRYRINGAPALTVSDAGTLTASPGDSLEVLWMNGSLTSYFSSVDTYTVPCKGTYTPDVKLLVSNGSITTTFFTDPNGQPVDGLGINQTLAAGDMKNVKTVVQGTYMKDFPYGVIVVAEFNKTSVDDVILLKRDSGTELTSAKIPQTHSPTFGTESTRKAYLMDPLISSTSYEYTTVLDADDSVSPTIGSDVIITYFALNDFINDKNGGAFEGPSAEDEYNVVTRSGQISATLEVE